MYTMNLQIMLHKIPIAHAGAEEIIIGVLTLLLALLAAPLFRKGLVFALWQLYDLLIRK
jgi:hypothetical protein